MLLDDLGSDEIAEFSEIIAARQAGQEALLARRIDELYLPRKYLSALIRMDQSNNGAVSAKRRKQFYYLPEKVLDRIKEVARRSKRKS